MLSGVHPCVAAGSEVELGLWSAWEQPSLYPLHLETTLVTGFSHCGAVLDWIQSHGKCAALPIPIRSGVAETFDTG